MLFQKKAPLLREHTPGLHAQKCIAAVNLFAESDGSQPGQPFYLCGCEQARHHRVVCNRGHNLLRSYVEAQDSGRFTSVRTLRQHYRRCSGLMQVRFRWFRRIPNVVGFWPVNAQPAEESQSHRAATRVARRAAHAPHIQPPHRGATPGRGEDRDRQAFFHCALAVPSTPHRQQYFAGKHNCASDSTANSDTVEGPLEFESRSAL
jgi:hypothetical protein